MIRAYFTKDIIFKHVQLLNKLVLVITTLMYFAYNEKLRSKDPFFEYYKLNYCLGEIKSNKALMSF